MIIKSCIYQILNIVSRKFYIGHATDYDNRWYEHERKLRHGSHDNPYLQHAWNKYGANAFEFIMVELVDDPANLLAREQFWIDKLGASDNIIGYNINPDAMKPPSPMGRKHSPASILKMSKAMTGLKRIDTSKMRKPKSEAHKRALSFSRRANSKWPHPEGYSCNCDECRYKRNRLKNYPNLRPST